MRIAVTPPTAQHARLRERSRRAPSAACRAFSLVELVIVILVMSIFAAVAVPKFVDSLLFHRVESAARRVKADLELVRHTARLTSATQSATFTTAGYTLSSACKDLDHPNNLYTVDLTASPFELDEIAANFAGTATISFDGYGTPSSSGSVVLDCKSHSCTVTLNGTTGEVAIVSNHAEGGTSQVIGN